MSKPKAPARDFESNKQTNSTANSTANQNFETNREYGQISANDTPEFLDFKKYEPDKTLLNAGTTAAFDQSRRGIVEGTSSPYSGVNPVLRARMQALGLQELATKESGVLSDADLERNKLKLAQKQAAMDYKKPQILENRSYGTSATNGTTVTNGTENTKGYGPGQQQPGMLGGILQGVAGVALGF